MLISGIKSRPVYPDRLVLDPSGRRHIVACLGQEAMAVLQESLSEPANPMIEAPVRILAAGTVGAVPAASNRVPLAETSLFDDDGQLLAALADLLADACMGLRLYAVGPEAFLWDVDHVARPHAFGKGEVVKFPAGSAARRIYCCHCKTVTVGATGSIHECAGCGTMLQVRDHFSRRLGAFMAVRADAEAPGEFPAREELFP
jgi:predicted RNA-binding Zn-ribbon protein involved in translation (DUF1610 family)